MDSSNDKEQHKSSAEILSELFSAFNAKPPNLDIEPEEKCKKHKKSKKKHKHKEKRHKKKSKHRRSSQDNSDSSDSDSENSQKHHKRHKSKRKSKDVALDLDSIFQNSVLVKQEPGVEEEAKIKQEKDKNGFEKFEVKLKEDPEKLHVKQEKGTLSSETACSNSNSKTETSENDSKTSIGAEKVNRKITIKNLKNSIVYEKTVKEVEEKSKQILSKTEDGEILDSDSGSKSDDIPNDRILDELIHSKDSKKESSKNDRKRKHSDRDKHDDGKKSRTDRRDEKRDKHRSHRSPSKEKHKHKKRSRSRERSRSYRSHRSHDRSEHRRRRSRSRTRSRSRSKDRRRRSNSPSSSKGVFGIDKKKLLEIARRNAISMLRSGTLPDALTLGPHAQEKVIAAIKAGGKTIEELTDFCKNLSRKEALGELSSVSSEEEDNDLDSNPDKSQSLDKVFHHPFQIKDKPSSIVMNIKNSTPLPIKTSKEKTAELRMQFPVSSGQLHRKTESEWVPVETPQAPAPVVVAPSQPAVVQPPATVMLPPPVPEVDIGAVVSQRLSAMRRLQENPNDMQAITQMQRVQKEMESWAQSKQQPGQFTGSTGANILSAAELSSGFQAWARKDQLTSAAPVSGGMGMHLLQKMGWRPGEGLGKEKSGQLEPLLLEVKLDKRGLVAGGEAGVGNKRSGGKSNPTSANNKSLLSKHPVSLLGEYASKRKLGVPQYEVCFECGPDHKKNFLFKVTLNGVEYKPNVASSTKKQAKADAASVCLQHLGVLPS